MKAKSGITGGAGTTSTPAGAEADGDDVVIKLRPDVTQKGQAMIGDYRTDALHRALDNADIPLDTLLGIAVLALAGKNVSVQSPAELGAPSRMRVMATICEGGVLSTDTAAIHQTARSMLKTVLSCRTNHTDSGVASRIAGDALCADRHLPHMGTEEFLSCLSRGALEAAAKGEDVSLGARVKDTRAALVKHTEGATWQYRGARFELTSDEFTRGTHEYRYVPGRSVAGGDEGEDGGGSVAGEDTGQDFDDARSDHDEIAA